MAQRDNIETEGIVTEVLRNTRFKVKLSNGHIIEATISGKLRMNYIQIFAGDAVKIEMSPYDFTKGRITWRGKSAPVQPQK
jgi:translation initiation factor IF-1